MKMKKYIWNCFLLLIPIFLWNILLVKYLPKGYSPEIFWENIPPLVKYIENISRIIVFALPALMLLSFETRVQRAGIRTYLVGLVFYFMSWGIVILYPESLWSTSQIGFMAPAFTTLIWFVGIGMVGQKSFIKIPYISTLYIILSILFVIVHSFHCYIVFQRFVE
ncbi:hypothetical protein AVL50_30185 [Flammeovirga sp. SJP92]|nr:hypothetical protein AVL50_30185 [Flammeovirga sp. SJP92]